MDMGEVEDLRESSDEAERKFWRKESLDVESGTVPGQGHGQDENFGLVFGDIGMSPLYVYASTFRDGNIWDPDDILGVLSLILYTLTFISMFKYVFFVVDAMDSGEDGTFGLYSLLCRHVNIGLIPSEQMEDQQCHESNRHRSLASCLKSKLENSRTAKILLLLATMFSTSMAITDGFFSPSISVLSAVEGIQKSIPSLEEDKIPWISAAILFSLFMVQRFGSYKVGYSFAAIICCWFALLGGIGFYNFFKFDTSVIKALNPKYIFYYFKRNKKDAWISLGGIVLAISGSESLCIDLGPFSVMSIRISMCCLVYPALVFTYVGQASYLRKHPESVFDSFYGSIPVPLYWLTLVVAMLSAIISSHYVISGTFYIIQQALSHGCFPSVKVIHTSSKNADEVYIPEINYILMFSCLGVILGFKDTTSIENGMAISLVLVMTLSSSFLVLIMILIWKTHILIIIFYVLTTGLLEYLYLSSVLYNIDQGGYLPFVFSGVLMTIMYTWNDVHRRKYFYELEHKISPKKLNDMIVSVNRVPGLALFYSEHIQDIPPIFKHYLANVRTLQNVLVFVSFKSLPICKVSKEQRFMFRRVKPDDINVFLCVVRYGYKDILQKQESFENILVKRLIWFIKESCMLQSDDGGVEEKKTRASKEIKVVGKGWKDGIVHLIGENEVVASKESGLAKRVLINYVYDALRRNMRQSKQVCYIPCKRRLKVGITYEL